MRLIEEGGIGGGKVNVEEENRGCCSVEFQKVQK